MTALETFTTASKPPLTTGRRPDMAAICAFEPFEATSRADVKRPLPDREGVRSSWAAVFRVV